MKRKKRFFIMALVCLSICICICICIFIFAIAMTLKIDRVNPDSMEDTCEVLQQVTTTVETVPMQVPEILDTNTVKTTPMQLLETTTVKLAPTQVLKFTTVENAYTQVPALTVRAKKLLNNNDKEQLKEEDEDIVYNLQDNLSNWFLSNDGTDTLTLWKKNDQDGNLLLSLRNQEGKTIITFIYERELYEWLSISSNEWIHCSEHYSEFTAQDVIDVTFTAYREVGGRKLEGVQFQAMVLFNREKSPDFANTLRGVITQTNPVQYSCRHAVLNRSLKSKNFLEEEDLEKCFRAVLLVFASELIEDVPEDIVWAASFPQGSGIWKKCDGTYYCHR